MSAVTILDPRPITNPSSFRAMDAAHKLLATASAMQATINEMQRSVGLAIEAAAKYCDWAVEDLLEEVRNPLADMADYGKDLQKAIDYEVAQLETDLGNHLERTGR